MKARIVILLALLAMATGMQAKKFPQIKPYEFLRPKQVQSLSFHFSKSLQ